MLSNNLVRFQKASFLLTQEFQRSKSVLANDTRLRNHAFQMAIVRLQDSWAQFVRGLITLSASGHALTVGGSNVSSSHGFTGLADVETWLTANRSSNRDPDWHVSTISISYARKLGVSNYSTISGAIGSSNSPEQDMRNYRNFVVHRNRETATKLKSTLPNRFRSLPDLGLLPLQILSGGVPIFDDWVRRSELVAKVASK